MPLHGPLGRTIRHWKIAMPRIKTLVEPVGGGWTRWTTPKTKGYRLTCCDCGLTHDMEFMVRLAGGIRMDNRRGQIKFRVRRNGRSTAAVRREARGKSK